MIGIVILNYFNYKVTERCIDSIISTCSIPFHVIVVDNGSSNDSVVYLMNRFKSVSYIEIISLPDNIGFAAGNNIGIQRCVEKGIDYCVLSNSDIIFERGSIEELILSLKRIDNSVIVGPKIFNPDGTIFHSSLLKPVRIIDVLEIGRFFPQRRIDENVILNPHKVYSVSGCCFAIDIKRFREIGAFDENTFLYNEENILGVQVQQSEYSTWFCPSSVVIHAHGASSGKRNTFVCKESLRSTVYYWKRYREYEVGLIKAVIWIYVLKMIIVSKKERVNLNINEIRKAGFLELSRKI